METLWRYDHMDSFMLALSVVLPLVVYMTVGGLIRKFSIFSKENFKTLNGLIFKVFIPLTLFVNVYCADLGDALQPGVFVLVLIQILILYLAASYIVPRIVKEPKDASTIIQGMYRSNFVLFGTTIADSLCGNEGAALVSALSAMVVPLFNILAVILFETNRGKTVSFTTILISIAKNPLVEAGALGTLFSLLHIKIPDFLMDPILDLSNIATPLALVTLGGILSFDSMKKHWKYLASTAAVRLVTAPLLMIFTGAFFGYRADILVVILAVFASPTAVASAPMAQTMGGNGELAGEIVASTSVLCVFTLFLFVFGLSQIGLI